jgi:ABC-type lipoprotein export system ATPase subunit
MVGPSRFHLCDLQVHTSADSHHKYGDVGGREPNLDFARQLVEAHANAGVTVLAVSDHNRVDWYPALREAGQACGVFVFPAMEFSVNRCHLLAIWDRTDLGFEMAQQFLTTLWKPGDDPFLPNGDPRPVGNGQVIELAERVREHKGLVIAPHATAKNTGFFASGVCTNRAEVIRASAISAYDVWGNSSADVLSNPASDFGELLPTWIISGDVRALDDVGARAVYLKLGSEPSLEGIRQAFLMPETRVRFPAHLQERWANTKHVRFIDTPEPYWPRIERVKIAGGFHDQLDIELGPGLNAVIGGKGTGKSTLIEILRYALHAGEHSSPDAEGNRKHNFKANAEASVSYRDDQGISYLVTRTGSGDAAELTRGTERVALDVSKRVAIRVFGQRELQSLADRGDVLRQFVAAQSGPTWESILVEEREVLTELRQINSTIDSLEASLDGLDDDEQELADLDDRLRVAVDMGVSALADKLSELSTANAGVADVLAWLRSVTERVDLLATSLPRPEVPAAPSNSDRFVEALDNLAEVVRTTTDQLKIATDETSAELAGANEVWASEFGQQRADIEGQLAEAGFPDPRELGKSQTRQNELRTRLAGLPDLRHKLDSAMSGRSDSLARLAEIRRRKSRIVEDAARSLDSAVGRRVRIRIDPLADKAEVRALLEQATQGQSVRSDQLKRLAETHTPSTLAQAIRSGATDVEKLGCSAATASKLAGLSPAHVRQIEEADTPDQIAVEVNLADGDHDESWQHVSDVSPGQRATALLALALAGGNEPLLIDQPEDDLDNRYIYEEVVSVLADVCHRRQVIVFVSEGGLEPPRPIRALGPQPSASANSATPTWPRISPGASGSS